MFFISIFFIFILFIINVSYTSNTESMAIREGISIVEKHKYDDLYVITVVFNSNSKRIELYNQFSKYMERSGVNLITVECIFGNETEFSITKKNNPNHIQLTAKHPLWPKENLINIAISKLPETWKYVLWIDSDIEFIENDWVDKVLEGFEKYDILHLYKFAYFLGPDNKQILRSFISLVYCHVNDVPFVTKGNKEIFRPHAGFGWGITKKGYTHIGKLFDVAIVGGADYLMGFSLTGKLERYIKNFRTSVSEWALKADIFRSEGKLGYADLTLKHFFHGFYEDRKAAERMSILTKNNYDPEKDIYYNEQGVIQLKDEKVLMIEPIKAYFQIRSEVRNNSELYEKYANYTAPSIKEILDQAFPIK